jgi:hypothetical protein
MSEPLTTRLNVRMCELGGGGGTPAKSSPDLDQGAGCCPPHGAGLGKGRANDVDDAIARAKKATKR